MKNFWQSNTNRLFTIVFLWIIFVVIAIAVAIHQFPFTPTFPYYTTDLSPHYNRFFSTFAHFDGIHYLRIASAGFYPDGGEVAFFPAYPFLIHGLINLGVDKLVAGISISLISLLISLLILHDLYPKHGWKFVALLLSFPASFYFLSVYTESLYLLAFALMLYFIKKKMYYAAALAVALSTATRFVGIAMIAYLVMSMWGRVDWKKIFAAALISLTGLASYMVYLWKTLGDPLAFIHSQPIFGMGRSGGEIVFLPQVIFRYLKMTFTADPSTLLYWRAVAEISLFILVVTVLIKYWRKLSLPELFYTLTVLIIPTLSGTLSSYPRYVLAAIPLLIVLSQELSKRSFILTILIQSVFLFVSIALFTSGLFVA
ncbi:MAG: hypothetical protein WAV40_03660 [Microgenomates group bacterium]